MDLSDLFSTASVPPATPDLEMRTTVKVEILRRVQWMSNDCSTFWRVRLEQTSWYKKATPEESGSGLGGGNFVMALAMLSICNFLSKAYSFITSPETLVTTEDRDRVKAAKATIKKACPEVATLFKNKTDWLPPKVGSCNETDAFVRLVAALSVSGIDLGLPASDARAVWDRFRNKLAHMAHPEGVVQVCAADSPLVDAVAAIRKTGPSFRFDGGKWICNADKLSIDVLTISDWLCDQVDACSDDARIRRLMDWMFQDTDLLSIQDSGT